MRTLLPEATVYLDVENGQKHEGDDAGAEQPGIYGIRLLMKTLKLLTNENSGILVVNSDTTVPCPVYVIVHVVGVNLEVQSSIIIISIYCNKQGSRPIEFKCSHWITV